MHGLFRTEKYGTVTIIHNETKQSGGSEEMSSTNTLEEIHDNNSSQITYEITPFREE